MQVCCRRETQQCACRSMPRASRVLLAAGCWAAAEGCPHLGWWPPAEVAPTGTRSSRLGCKKEDAVTARLQGLQPTFGGRHQSKPALTANHLPACRRLRRGAPSQARARRGGRLGATPRLARLSVGWQPRLAAPVQAAAILRNGAPGRASRGASAPTGARLKSEGGSAQERRKSQC